MVIHFLFIDFIYYLVSLVFISLTIFFPRYGLFLFISFYYPLISSLLFYFVVLLILFFDFLYSFIEFMHLSPS